VTVSSPAYQDYPLVGTIAVIDPVINQTTRGVQVIARVENEKRRLRPGMSADISVVLQSRPGALTIPDEAIFAEGNQDFVYVVNPDSSVTRTVVTLGSRQAGAVEITQGLFAGQSIVRAGHQKLYEGAKVMPVQSGAPDNMTVPEENGAEPTSADAT
jgi:membrane fusion protein (multidrug efflux system)